MLRIPPQCNKKNRLHMASGINKGTVGSNLYRVTENAEIYWSRAFRLVKFHEISAVFDGRKRPTPYSRSACLL
jgi:uncharacterized membrane protein YjjP (DUF1212 family)